ncbi:hypothetical protein EJB05_36881, partial [Eragrostis curvula]
MASPSCASSCTRLTIRRAIPEPLPLIECPYHPDRTVVKLIADTQQNRGKIFYRCMENASTPQACSFFKRKNEYSEYLVDGGFLEEPEEPMPTAVAKTDDAVGKRSTPFGPREMIHSLP